MAHRIIGKDASRHAVSPDGVLASRRARDLASKLHWVPEFLMLRRGRARARARLLGAAMLVGVVAGLGAVVFVLVSRLVTWGALEHVVGYRATATFGEPTFSWLPPATRALAPALLVVAPAVGGLLSGLLVFTLAPEAEGHGTDAAIEAYHRGAFIRPRVPLIKLLASAITIGSGGSGGREGPIAQIGAGFGSLLARALRLSFADRRVLLGAGVGAGIAAIFRSPLAGALFASEVLYSSPEFEPEVIIPAGVASVMSYCTFGAFFGYKPLFSTPDVVFDDPTQLGPYFVLALFVTLLAMAYTRTFHGLTRLFHRWPIAPHVKPAIGGALSGGIALLLFLLFGRHDAVLAVLSYGYDSIQQSMTDASTMGVSSLLAIALGKIVTTGLTIGSGGSGGVFGPSMVIGGCGGGAVGLVFHRIAPHLVPHPGSFVIVGMAGFFAAAAKTPFSTIVIVSEMTGGYGLLLPTLWVCTLAFVLADERSIYSSQVEGRSRSPAHRETFVRDLLKDVRVMDLLSTVPPSTLSLRASDDWSAAAALAHESGASVFPVVGDDGKLAGVLEITSAAQRAIGGSPLVGDIMDRGVAPLGRDDDLSRALERLSDTKLIALPVVDGDGQVIGMLARSDVGSALLRMRTDTKPPTA